MCKTPKASKSAGSPPPTIIDGAAAARDEMALRRKRSGARQLNRSGNRFGDLGQPSLALKALMGGG
jgi:hypothetical protein